MEEAVSEMRLQVGSRTVSNDGPPFVIAEIGVNHDGDMAVARQLVQAAKSAGAHAVKFQLFEAKMLLATEAGLVEYQKSAAGSAGELLQGLELSAPQMKELVALAHSLGLVAITTPFSPQLVEAAVSTGIDAIKLASPDLVNRPLVEAAMAAGLPLILSTGAATMEEIERTLLWLGPAADRTIFLHCVSSYPTPPEHAALGAIGAMRSRWPGMRVGYSDHTIQTVTGGLAVAAGACVLEKHLTLDKRRKGPDHAASLEPDEFRAYVEQARAASAMRGAMQKHPSPIELEVRMQARQSVVAARPLAANDFIGPDDITVKRPGTGIPAAEFSAVIGRRLARAVAANALLHWTDLAGGQP